MVWMTFTISFLVVLYLSEMVLSHDLSFASNAKSSSTTLSKSDFRLWRLFVAFCISKSLPTSLSVLVVCVLVVSVLVVWAIVMLNHPISINIPAINTFFFIVSGK